MSIDMRITYRSLVIVVKIKKKSKKNGTEKE